MQKIQQISVRSKWNRRPGAQVKAVDGQTSLSISLPDLVIGAPASRWQNLSKCVDLYASSSKFFDFKKHLMIQHIIAFHDYRWIRRLTVLQLPDFSNTLACKTLCHDPEEHTHTLSPDTWTSLYLNITEFVLKPTMNGS